jgi:hypothetical protein
MIEDGAKLSTDEWAVVVGENGQGNPLNPGYLETVLDQPSEIAARQVYRDSVKAAQAGRYKSVKLRHGGEVIEEWP